MNALLRLADSAKVDMSAFNTALTGSITPADVVVIVAGFIGVCMAFVLMYIGIRKGLKMFNQAVDKGKVSV